MKTQNTEVVKLNIELKELPEVNMILVKAGIIIFGIVLNICFVQLFF